MTFLLRGQGRVRGRPLYPDVPPGGDPEQPTSQRCFAGAIPGTPSAIMRLESQSTTETVARVPSGESPNDSIVSLAPANSVSVRPSPVCHTENGRFTRTGRPLAEGWT